MQPVPPADGEPAPAAVPRAVVLAYRRRHLDLARRRTAAVPTTAIYSPRDGIVAWTNCVDEPGPGRENVAIDGPHSTMLANPATIRIVADRLARPDLTFQS